MRSIASGSCENATALNKTVVVRTIQFELQPI